MGNLHRAKGRISIHALREEGDDHLEDILRKHIISIHALREEGDGDVLPHHCFQVISIHALREEGDPRLQRSVSAGARFLSTPSVRRATCCGWPSGHGPRYFYPRPP